MQIKIKRLNPDIKLPNYAHPGDVGMDVYATEEVTIPPGEHRFIHHGFAMEFPEGYAAIVKDKSSISKAGLHAIGGVFDAGYRGEYNSNIFNLSSESYTFEKGDKVSQIVIVPVALADVVEVNELSDSARGLGAFGSTGKQ